MSRLDEIKARHAATTAGQWGVQPGVMGRYQIVSSQNVVTEVKFADGSPSRKVEGIAQRHVAEYRGHKDEAEAVVAAHDLILKLDAAYEDQQLPADLTSDAIWDFSRKVRALPRDDDRLVITNPQGTFAEISSATMVNRAVDNAPRGVLATVAHDDGSGVAGDVQFISHAIEDAIWLLDRIADLLITTMALAGSDKRLLVDVNDEPDLRAAGPWHLDSEGHVVNDHRAYAGDFLLCPAHGAEKVLFKNGDQLDLRRWNLRLVDVRQPHVVLLDPEIVERVRDHAEREGVEASLFIAAALAQAVDR